jgi:hypothetical protein
VQLHLPLGLPPLFGRVARLTRGACRTRPLSERLARRLGERRHEGKQLLLPLLVSAPLLGRSEARGI